MGETIDEIDSNGDDDDVDVSESELASFLTALAPLQ